MAVGCSTAALAELLQGSQQTYHKQHELLTQTVSKQHVCAMHSATSGSNLAHHEVPGILGGWEGDCQVLNASIGNEGLEGVHLGLVCQADVGDHGSLQPAGAAQGVGQGCQKWGWVSG
jgi:hypothetical protein